MKKLVSCLVFVLLLSSCAPVQFTPISNSTLIFTTTPFSTMTETPLPTLIPTATLPPVAVECDVDKNITEDICTFVESSVLLGRYTLIKYFGKDISGPVKFHFLNDPTKVSTDLSLPDHKSAGFYVDNNLTVQVNIASRGWMNYGEKDFIYRRITVLLHEMTHVWQAQNKCDLANSDNSLRFVAEGQATYVPLSATDHLELINPGQALVMWSHMNYVESDWIYSGDVAIVAYKELMDKTSPKNYLVFCDLLAKGTFPRDAFQKAYGISIQEFIREFKEKILGSQKNCTQATCGSAVSLYQNTQYGTLTPLIDHSLNAPNLIIKITDQDGKPVSDVNLQLFRRLYNNFYYGTGGEDAGTNTDGILFAPVIPGTYSMRFCQPGYRVGMYSGDVDKCVYELNPFEVIPGETKTINFQYWDIQDHSLSAPNFLFTLLGVDGQPVSNQYVKVCGYDEISSVCLNGKTDEHGVFSASLKRGVYLVRLVQPGQGEMDPRGYSNPRYGLNLNPYQNRPEYEIKDVEIQDKDVKSITYQFPVPNLQIKFLDANGSPVPNIDFILCKSADLSSSASNQIDIAEKQITNKILSMYYSNYESKAVKVDSLDGYCFLNDHTDKSGIFQLYVDPGKYFIYFDNPGFAIDEDYFDHMLSNIVVSDKDVTSVFANFK